MTHVLVFEESEAGAHRLPEELILDHVGHRDGEWLLHNHVEAVCETEGVHVGRMKRPSRSDRSHDLGAFKHGRTHLFVICNIQIN